MSKTRPWSLIKAATKNTLSNNLATSSTPAFITRTTDIHVLYLECGDHRLLRVDDEGGFFHHAVDHLPTSCQHEREYSYHERTEAEQ